MKEYAQLQRTLESLDAVSDWTVSSKHAQYTGPMIVFLAALISSLACMSFGLLYTQQFYCSLKMKDLIWGESGLIS